MPGQRSLFTHPGLFVPVMLLDVDQRALISQIRFCVLSNAWIVIGGVERQRYRCRVSATGDRICASVLAFCFLRHPAPTALDLRPLRQKGTLLATGAGL